MGIRDVGKLGEKLIDQWATEQGITINKSIEDEKGWDFFIEYPDSITSKYSLSKFPSPVKCLLQIKSTDSLRKRVAWKLSNWRNLAQTEFPAFLVVIDFSNENHPKGIHVIHVWEDIIKEVFKKFGKIGDAEKLHTVKHSVKFGDSEKIENCDSNTLFTHIIEQIKPNIQKYIINKSAIISKYSRYDHSFDFKIKFKIPEPYKKNIDRFLVDHSLGIVGAIEIDDLIVHDKFVAEKKIWDGVKTISLKRKNLGKSEFKMSADDDSKDIRLELDTYYPSAISHLVDKKELKILFEGQYFRFIQYINKKFAYFFLELPKSNEQVEISSYQDAVRIIKFLKYVENEGKRIHLKTFLGDKFERSRKIFPLKNIDKEIYQYFILLDKTINLSEFFDIKNKLRISLNEILSKDSSITILHGIINKTIQINFKEVFSDEKMVEDREVATIITSNVSLGGYNMLLMIKIIATPSFSHSDDEFNFYKTDNSTFEIVKKEVSMREFKHEEIEELRDKQMEVIRNDKSLQLIEFDEVLNKKDQDE